MLIYTYRLKKAQRHDCDNFAVKMSKEGFLLLNLMPRFSNKGHLCPSSDYQIHSVHINWS